MAPRDPLLEKDKRLEKVRHLLSFPCSGLQELAQSAGRGALASACGAGAASGAHPRRGLVAQSIAEVHRLTQALEDEHQRAETEKAKAEKLVCIKHSARGSAANARGTPAHTPRRACPRRRCTTA